MIERFAEHDLRCPVTHIHVAVGGHGPPLLLLHGFPQTHVMWRDVALHLASDFTVVCADLRGYGRSGCPPTDAAHAPYGKRALAQDMVDVMAQLGFAQFALAGHDRGGRVAYRLALDHPGHVTRVAVLDVLPIDTAWQHVDERFALGYWPWTLLAQQPPLPERVLMLCADAVVDQALCGWGTPAHVFPLEVRAAYIEPLRDVHHAHAICEEYRAAASIDRLHDRADVSRAHRIACPLLCLWSAHGPLGTWYERLGGPLAIWRSWCDDVRGEGLPAGHFFPEELPLDTARALRRFLQEA